jgi:type IV pilus assembly protein PilB
VEFLEKHQLLPLYRKDDTLMLAVADPTDLSSLDELKFLTGLRIDCAVAARQDIHKAIDYYFHGRACPELRENEKNVLQAGRSAEPQKNIPIPPLGKTERLDSDVVSEQRDAVRMIKALAELLVEKKLVKADELAKHGIAL